MELTVEQFKALTVAGRHEYMRCQPRRGYGTKREAVLGGAVNDVNYPVVRKSGTGRVADPAYQCWYNLMIRVFSESYQRDYPAYSGVSVDPAWLRLSGFTEWWLENQVDGWELDKDLLSDAKVYSPETCIFVPGWLNKLTLSSAGSRGLLPVGVSRWRGCFQSKVRNRNKTEFLGLFDSVEAAHQAWKKRKLELAYERRAEMDIIDARIYPRVLEIIERAC